VALSNAVLFATVLVCALGVAVILARTLSARRVQTRQERLKAHLDWVNRTPQTSRKRSLLRG
jgi:cell division protein FtsL